MILKYCCWTGLIQDELGGFLFGFGFFNDLFERVTVSGRELPSAHQLPKWLQQQASDLAKNQVSHTGGKGPST